MTSGSLSGEFTSVPNKAFSLKYDNNSVVATYQ